MSSSRRSSVTPADDEGRKENVRNSMEKVRTTFFGLCSSSGTSSPMLLSSSSPTRKQNPGSGGEASSTLGHGAAVGAQPSNLLLDAFRIAEIEKLQAQAERRIAKRRKMKPVDQDGRSSVREGDSDQSSEGSLTPLSFHRGSLRTKRKFSRLPSGKASSVSAHEMKKKLRLFRDPLLECSPKVSLGLAVEIEKEKSLIEQEAKHYGGRTFIFQTHAKFAEMHEHGTDCSYWVIQRLGRWIAGAKANVRRYKRIHQALVEEHFASHSSMHQLKGSANNYTSTSSPELLNHSGSSRFASAGSFRTYPSRLGIARVSQREKLVLCETVIKEGRALFSYGLTTYGARYAPLIDAVAPPDPLSPKTPKRGASKGKKKKESPQPQKAAEPVVTQVTITRDQWQRFYGAMVDCVRNASSSFFGGPKPAPCETNREYLASTAAHSSPLTEDSESVVLLELPLSMSSDEVWRNIKRDNDNTLHEAEFLQWLCVLLDSQATESHRPKYCAMTRHLEVKCCGESFLGEFSDSAVTLCELWTSPPQSISQSVISKLSGTMLSVFQVNLRDKAEEDAKWEKKNPLLSASIKKASTQYSLKECAERAAQVCQLLVYYEVPAEMQKYRYQPKAGRKETGAYYSAVADGPRCFKCMKRLIAHGWISPQTDFGALDSSELLSTPPSASLSIPPEQRLLCVDCVPSYVAQEALTMIQQREQEEERAAAQSAKEATARAAYFAALSAAQTGGEDDSQRQLTPSAFDDLVSVDSLTASDFGVISETLRQEKRRVRQIAKEINTKFEPDLVQAPEGGVGGAPPSLGLTLVGGDATMPSGGGPQQQQQQQHRASHLGEGSEALLGFDASTTAVPGLGAPPAPSLKTAAAEAPKKRLTIGEKLAIQLEKQREEKEKQSAVEEQRKKEEDAQYLDLKLVESDDEDETEEFFKFADEEEFTLEEPFVPVPAESRPPEEEGSPAGAPEGMMDSVGGFAAGEGRAKRAASSRGGGEQQGGAGVGRASPPPAAGGAAGRASSRKASEARTAKAGSKSAVVAEERAKGGTKSQAASTSSTPVVPKRISPHTSGNIGSKTGTPSGETGGGVRSRRSSTASIGSDRGDDLGSRGRLGSKGSFRRRGSKSGGTPLSTPPQEGIKMPMSEEETARAAAAAAEEILTRDKKIRVERTKAAMGEIAKAQERAREAAERTAEVERQLAINLLEIEGGGRTSSRRGSLAAGSTSLTQFTSTMGSSSGGSMDLSWCAEDGQQDGEKKEGKRKLSSKGKKGKVPKNRSRSTSLVPGGTRGIGSVEGEGGTLSPPGRSLSMTEPPALVGVDGFHAFATPGLATSVGSASATPGVSLITPLEGSLELPTPPSPSATGEEGKKRKKKKSTRGGGGATPMTPMTPMLERVEPKAKGKGEAAAAVDGEKAKRRSTATGTPTTSVKRKSLKRKAEEEEEGVAGSPVEGGGGDKPQPTSPVVSGPLDAATADTATAGSRAKESLISSDGEGEQKAPSVSTTPSSVVADDNTAPPVEPSATMAMVERRGSSPLPSPVVEERATESGKELSSSPKIHGDAGRVPAKEEAVDRSSTEEQVAEEKGAEADEQNQAFLALSGSDVTEDQEGEKPFRSPSESSSEGSRSESESESEGGREDDGEEDKGGKGKGATTGSGDRDESKVAAEKLQTAHPEGAQPQPQDAQFQETQLKDDHVPVSEETPKTGVAKAQGESEIHADDTMAFTSTTQFTDTMEENSGGPQGTIQSRKQRESAEGLEVQGHCSSLSVGRADRRRSSSIMSSGSSAASGTSGGRTPPQYGGPQFTSSPFRSPVGGALEVSSTAVFSPTKTTTSPGGSPQARHRRVSVPAEGSLREWTPRSPSPFTTPRLSGGGGDGGSATTSTAAAGTPHGMTVIGTRTRNGSVETSTGAGAAEGAPELLLAGGGGTSSASPGSRPGNRSPADRRRSSILVLEEMVAASQQAASPFGTPPLLPLGSPSPSGPAEFAGGLSGSSLLIAGGGSSVTTSSGAFEFPQQLSPSSSGAMLPPPPSGSGRHHRRSSSVRSPADLPWQPQYIERQRQWWFESQSEYLANTEPDTDERAALADTTADISVAGKSASSPTNLTSTMALPSPLVTGGELGCFVRGHQLLLSAVLDAQRKLLKLSRIDATALATAGSPGWKSYLTGLRTVFGFFISALAKWVSVSTDRPFRSISTSTSMKQAVQLLLEGTMTSISSTRTATTANKTPSPAGGSRSPQERAEQKSSPTDRSGDEHHQPVGEEEAERTAATKVALLGGSTGLQLALEHGLETGSTTVTTQPTQQHRTTTPSLSKKMEVGGGASPPGSLLGVGLHQKGYKELVEVAVHWKALWKESVKLHICFDQWFEHVRVLVVPLLLDHGHHYFSEGLTSMIASVESYTHPSLSSSQRPVTSGESAAAASFLATPPASALKPQSARQKQTPSPGHLVEVSLNVPSPFQSLSGGKEGILHAVRIMQLQLLEDFAWAYLNRFVPSLSRLDTLHLHEKRVLEKVAGHLLRGPQVLFPELTAAGYGKFSAPLAPPELQRRSSVDAGGGKCPYTPVELFLKHASVLSLALFVMGPFREARALLLANGFAPQCIADFPALSNNVQGSIRQSFRTVAQVERDLMANIGSTCSSGGGNPEGCRSARRRSLGDSTGSCSSPSRARRSSSCSSTESLEAFQFHDRWQRQEDEAIALRFFQTLLATPKKTGVQEGQQQEADQQQQLFSTEILSSLSNELQWVGKDTIASYFFVGRPFSESFSVGGQLILAALSAVHEPGRTHFRIDPPAPGSSDPSPPTGAAVGASAATDPKEAAVVWGDIAEHLKEFTNPLVGGALVGPATLVGLGGSEEEEEQESNNNQARATGLPDWLPGTVNTIAESFGELAKSVGGPLSPSFSSGSPPLSGRRMSESAEYPTAGTPGASGGFGVSAVGRVVLAPGESRRYFYPLSIQKGHNHSVGLLPFLAESGAVATQQLQAREKARRLFKLHWASVTSLATPSKKTSGALRSRSTPGGGRRSRSQSRERDGASRGSSVGSGLDDSEEIHGRERLRQERERMFLAVLSAAERGFDPKQHTWEGRGSSEAHRGDWEDDNIGEKERPDESAATVKPSVASLIEYGIPMTVTLRGKFGVGDKISHRASVDFLIPHRSALAEYAANRGKAGKPLAPGERSKHGAMSSHHGHHQRRPQEYRSPAFDEYLTCATAEHHDTPPQLPDMVWVSADVTHQKGKYKLASVVGNTVMTEEDLAREQGRTLPTASDEGGRGDGGLSTPSTRALQLQAEQERLHALVLSRKEAATTHERSPQTAQLGGGHALDTVFLPSLDHPAEGGNIPAGIAELLRKERQKQAGGKHHHHGGRKSPSPNVSPSTTPRCISLSPLGTHLPPLDPHQQQQQQEPIANPFDWYSTATADSTRGNSSAGARDQHRRTPSRTGAKGRKDFERTTSLGSTSGTATKSKRTAQSQFAELHRQKLYTPQPKSRSHEGDGEGGLVLPPLHGSPNKRRGPEPTGTGSSPTKTPPTTGIPAGKSKGTDLRHRLQRVTVGGGRQAMTPQPTSKRRPL